MVYQESLVMLGLPVGFQDPCYRPGFKVLIPLFHNEHCYFFTFGSLAL